MYIMTEDGWKLLSGNETHRVAAQKLEHAPLMGHYDNDEAIQMAAERKAFDTAQQDAFNNAYLVTAALQKQHLATPTGLTMADVDVTTPTETNEPLQTVTERRKMLLEQMFLTAIKRLTRQGFAAHVIAKDNRYYVAPNQWSSNLHEAAVMGFHKATNKAEELGAVATPMAE